MNKKILLPSVLVLLIMLSIGQSKGASAASYAGSYKLISGYTTGIWAGLFSYGVATAARDGKVAYSSYFPYKGKIGYGTGVVNSSGLFALNNGVTGSLQIYTRAGYGSFSDRIGSGFFAIGR